MKRVLMLSDTASLQDLNNRCNLNLLLELNCDVHVGCNFLFGNTTPPDRVYAFRDELEEAGISWHQLNFIYSPDKPVKDPDIITEIEGILQEYRFDLIHCLSPSALLCAAKPAAKLRIPLFFTSYGFPFYKGAGPLRWLRCYRKFKQTVKHADVLICTNREDYALAEKSFTAKHTYRIPGIGIDPYRFRAPSISRAQMRERLEIPQNAVTLITIGALTADKNHAVILKAMSRLRMLELHYVIVGTGPKTDALYQLTSHLNLEDRVHFTKYRDDVADILHACDIFCLPSRREALGIAALEAMEAGLPLVTSNVQGIRDFMEDGATGFMFKPKDINGFVAGIEALTEDKRLRQHMGEHNRYAVEPFYRENPEHIMRQLYQVQLDLNPDGKPKAAKLRKRKRKKKRNVEI
ncbi:MAG: glycosyltransferase [Ruminococcus sp.]|nr:glycosyltransferase [Ruminococcus sp.]